MAIVQLVRAYSGDVIGGPFKGLDGANFKARKGDYAGAIANTAPFWNRCITRPASDTSRSRTG